MSFARASALCQVSICSFRRTQVRGEMKSEIFLYGHFFYGHRLGRYVRPDDLNKRRSKKNRSHQAPVCFWGSHDRLVGTFNSRFCAGRQ